MSERQHPAWCQGCMRFGQVNLRETDPEALDVGEWAEFWRRCGIHGIVLNACGITAYYPTRIPLHRKSPWLGNRDLFGELCAAAKAQGLRVLARVDPSRTERDIYEAHPDWFITRPDGSVSRAEELYQTCLNSPYYYEYVPSLFREIHENYDVDGFFGNAWSGARELCHCPHCREKYRRDLGQDLPVERTAEWEQWRTKCDEDLWRFWDDFTKQIKPDTIWMGNHGVSRIADLAAMINADFQRRERSTPIWVSGEMGKRMRALTETRKPYFHIHSPNVASRHLARPEAEQRLWLAEAVAADSRPWFTFIGGVQWDRRQFGPIERFYHWHTENEAYFKDRQSLAGVVLLDLGRGEAYQGMYAALLRARIPFDLLHPSKITARTTASQRCPLSRYQVLVLADAARLSDADCDAIRQFARGGGGVVATFQTSLFDEAGTRRADFGLADLFGARCQGKPTEPLSHSYLRIEDPAHLLVEGIEDTDRTLFGGQMVPVAAAARTPPILTLIPPYPTYPPEKSFPRVERTDTPLVFAREAGNSRSVYFPGQIDRLFWELNLPDHMQLLANAVTWAAKRELPVRVTGPGLLDVHAYRQGEANLQVHLVNLSNPDIWKTPVHELIPVGPEQVTLPLPPGKQVRSVRLLVSDQTLSFDQESGTVTVQVPQVVDHEVVVVEF